MTIKKIKDDGDKSQFFLITAAATTPVIVYVLTRIIYDLVKFGRVIPLTGNVFVVMGLIQLVVILYMGYWTLEVLKKG